MTQPYSQALGLSILVLTVLFTMSCEVAGLTTKGTPSTPETPTTPEVFTLRALPADFSTRKAVAWSGYREVNGGPLTAAQIHTDLVLMKGAGFGLLRVFGSNNDMVKTLLSEIANPANNFDFKVQLGIWIDRSKALSDAANQAEITAGVALAKQYPNIVIAVSVGNEKMVDWNTWAPCPAADMIAYIKQVRGQITQPVTTDDNWAVFANNSGKYPKTEELLATLDYVAMHTYPLADTKYGVFDWQQTAVAANLRAAAMMDAAINNAKKEYSAVQAFLTLKGYSTVPIVIGETGWKSFANDGETSRAHPVNQKMYYDRLAAWTDGPKAIFYFEAFDEPWKDGDDMWGLWDVNRNPKYVISGTGYTASDAVYFIPVVASGAVTKATYLAYADTLTTDATTALPGGTTKWDAWDGNTGLGAEKTASGADSAGEGTKYLQITPVPKDWGWGFVLNNPSPDNLTNFQASGHLTFKIRTTYPGKLEVGFFTKGATTTAGDSDVYITLASGQYGYNNDGSWHNVSIPISVLAANAKPAFKQPSTAVMNLALLGGPFVIADRYATTKNASSSTNKIDVDAIAWTLN